MITCYYSQQVCIPRTPSPGPCWRPLELFSIPSFPCIFLWFSITSRWPFIITLRLFFDSNWWNWRSAIIFSAPGMMFVLISTGLPSGWRTPTLFIIPTAVWPFVLLTTAFSAVSVPVSVPVSISFSMSVSVGRSSTRASVPVISTTATLFVSHHFGASNVKDGIKQYKFNIKWHNTQRNTKKARWTTYSYTHSNTRRCSTLRHSWCTPKGVWETCSLFSRFGMTHKSTNLASREIPSVFSFLFVCYSDLSVLDLLLS